MPRPGEEDRVWLLWGQHWSRKGRTGGEGQQWRCEINSCSCGAQLGCDRLDTAESDACMWLRQKCLQCVFYRDQKCSQKESNRSLHLQMHSRSVQGSALGGELRNSHLK